MEREGGGETRRGGEPGRPTFPPSRFIDGWPVSSDAGATSSYDKNEVDARAVAQENGSVERQARS